MKALRERVERIMPGTCSINVLTYPNLTLSVHSTMNPARSNRWHVVLVASRQELDMSSISNQSLRDRNDQVRNLACNFRVFLRPEYINQDYAPHQGLSRSFNSIRHGLRGDSTLAEQFGRPSERASKIQIFALRAYTLTHTSDTTSPMTFCSLSMYSDA